MSKVNVSRDDVLRALTTIRGGQRISNPNPEATYEALAKYGRDLTQLARLGKLDPVIGRDEEVRRIVMDGEKKAWEVLGANVDKLNAVADALMEYETISGEETELVMNGGKIVRKEDDEDTKGPLGSAVPAAGAVRPPREEPDTGGMEPQPT